MRTNGLAAVVGVGLAFITGGEVSAAADVSEPASLCAADETIIFACEVGAKLASICARPGTVKDELRTVQYRFGRQSRIELSYPADPTQFRSSFHFSSNGYSGGGAAHISFSNAGVDYLVYDLFQTAPPDNHGRRYPALDLSGVLVTQNGRRIASLRCRRPWLSTIRGPSYTSLPKEPFEEVSIPGVP